MSKTVKKSSFEAQLKELETIVNSMEQGDMALDEALKQFEQGVKLTQNCQKLLDNAHQKVQVLTEDSNQLSDFSTTDN